MTDNLKNKPMVSVQTQALLKGETYYSPKQQERLEVLYKILPIAGNLQTAFAYVEQLDFWLKDVDNKDVTKK